MNHLFAIALTTFRESLRSKILYVVFFFGAALVSVASLFGSVTIGDQSRVVKDFGLFAVSLFPIGFAVIAGSALLHKELAKKTIYNILAKPVTRYEFLLGKYLGMLSISTLLLVLMGASLSIFLILFEQRIDPLLFQAYLYSFFELSIICAAAIFFSSVVVTPLLAGLFTFGVFLAGRSTAHLLYFINEGSVADSSAVILKILYWLLPHLDHLVIANVVVYGEKTSFADMVYSLAYSGGYAGVLLVLAQIFFNKREFN